MSNYVNLMDIVYPVGSVFISNTSISPADSIGGTWTKLDSDTFICCGTPNTTGGANSIRLTINEMPSHNHRVAGWGEWLGTNNQNYMRITLNGGIKTMNFPGVLKPLKLSRKKSVDIN